MKKPIFACVFAAGFTLISAQANAQSPGRPNIHPVVAEGVYNCYELFDHNHYRVFYVNGIASQPEDNIRALKAVRGVFTERYEDYINDCDGVSSRGTPDQFTESFDYVAQHNPSNGRLLDMYETLGFLEKIPTTRYLRELYLAQGGPGRQPDYFMDLDARIDIRPELVEWLYRRELSSFGSFPSEAALEWSAALDERGTVWGKRCPIIIGYSQGAILSNIAWFQFEDFRDPDCASMFHIGSPDSYIAGISRSIGEDFNQYVTLEEDTVVNFVRGIPGAPEPLPANTSNLILQDPQRFGHGLTQDYFVGNARNNVNRLLDRFVFCADDDEALCPEEFLPD